MPCCHCDIINAAFITLLTPTKGATLFRDHEWCHKRHKLIEIRYTPNRFVCRPMWSPGNFDVYMKYKKKTYHKNVNWNANIFHLLNMKYILPLLVIFATETGFRNTYNAAYTVHWLCLWGNCRVCDNVVPSPWIVCIYTSHISYLYWLIRQIWNFILSQIPILVHPVIAQPCNQCDIICARFIIILS